MPIYQRGKTWWCDFATPSGTRVRQSLGTRERTQAEELYDKLKAERWRVERLGEKPAYTWDEACIRYLREKDGKKSLSDDITKIKYFTGFFRGRELRSIKRDEVINAVSKLVYGRSGPYERTKGNGKPIKSSTKNRYLTFASTLFRLAAYEWEWIEKAHVFKKATEQSKRVRWLTKQEASRLISELAPHLQSAVQFALATGLRHGNIVDLEWSQVNLIKKMAWIHADQAKAGEAIGIPLNQTAIDALIPQVGKHPKWVFTYKGKKLKGAGGVGFRSALKRSGIHNFRFHDLRHTWASWLVQAGVPLHVIQELGGWHSFAMVKRYAHLAPEHLREHAGCVDQLLDGGTNLSHQRRSDDGSEIKIKAQNSVAP